jgi:hypothetical protein
MRAFEELLVPGSTEVPDCQCGSEMRLSGAKEASDAEIRIFKCDYCQHELQLMVWKPTELHA